MNDLDWTPPPCDRLTVLPAGRHWDAVRTDTRTARWAFGFLDAIERSAAIVDSRTGSVHWLVPPGEAARAPYDDWERLRQHVTVLTAGPTVHYVGVPAGHLCDGGGPRWHVPAAWSGSYVTQSHLLAAVLGTAVVRAHGPAGLAPQCAVCGRAMDRASMVTTVGRLRRGDPLQHLESHPTCAHAVMGPEVRREAAGVAGW